MAKRPSRKQAKATFRAGARGSSAAQPMLGFGVGFVDNVTPQLKALKKSYKDAIAVISRFNRDLRKQVTITSTLMATMAGSLALPQYRGPTIRAPRARGSYAPPPSSGAGSRPHTTGRYQNTKVANSRFAALLKDVSPHKYHYVTETIGQRLRSVYDKQLKRMGPQAALHVAVRSVLSEGKGRNKVSAKVRDAFHRLSETGVDDITESFRDLGQVMALARIEIDKFRDSTAETHAQYRAANREEATFKNATKQQKMSNALRRYTANTRAALGSYVSDTAMKIGGGFFGGMEEAEALARATGGSAKDILIANAGQGFHRYGANLLTQEGLAAKASLFAAGYKNPSQNMASLAATVNASSPLTADETSATMFALRRLGGTSETATEKMFAQLIEVARESVASIHDLSETNRDTAETLFTLGITGDRAARVLRQNVAATAGLRDAMVRSNAGNDMARAAIDDPGRAAVTARILGYADPSQMVDDSLRTQGMGPLMRHPVFAKLQALGPNPLGSFASAIQFDALSRLLNDQTGGGVDAIGGNPALLRVLRNGGQARQRAAAYANGREDIYGIGRASNAQYGMQEQAKRMAFAAAPEVVREGLAFAEWAGAPDLLKGIAGDVAKIATALAGSAAAAGAGAGTAAAAGAGAAAGVGAGARLSMLAGLALPVGRMAGKILIPTIAATVAADYYLGSTASVWDAMEAGDDSVKRTKRALATEQLNLTKQQKDLVASEAELENARVQAAATYWWDRRAWSLRGYADFYLGRGMQIDGYRSAENVMNRELYKAGGGGISQTPAQTVYSTAR